VRIILTLLLAIGLMTCGYVALLAHLTMPEVPITGRMRTCIQVTWKEKMKEEGRKKVPPLYKEREYLQQQIEDKGEENE
jgi:hypothetical protein